MSARLVDRMAWKPLHVVVPDVRGDRVMTVYAKDDMLPGEYAAMFEATVTILKMLMVGHATIISMRQKGPGGRQSHGGRQDLTD